jgi:GTPase SAR1 family protein
MQYLITGQGDNNPPGFKLHRTLQADAQSIKSIKWSQDGNFLASPTYNRTIRLWDVNSGELYKTLKGSSTSPLGEVYSVAWSPGGWTLASASSLNLLLWNRENGQVYRTFERDNTNDVAWSPDGRILASSSNDYDYIRLWKANSGQFIQLLRGRSPATCMAWSPDGLRLAVGSNSGTITLWDTEIHEIRRNLVGHSSGINDIVWSQDGKVIATASSDHTIMIWNTDTGRQLRTLEGHTEPVICVSFSSDDRLLASRDYDGKIRLWRCDLWETVVELNNPASANSKASNYGLAFHPHAPTLAITGETSNSSVHIWDIELATLLGATTIPSIHYMNAKVVLVGDTGVGKSGLGLVLAGQIFVPTDSTHSRRVWTMESKEVKHRNKIKEIRETLLWDLAGQPGYRLVHQLHLNEVAVALIVIDSRSETDPFAGVYHWARALRLAQRAQGDTALPMKKFLVAARIDRGGRSVSNSRINTLIRELNFDNYFETSAKEGWNIPLLTEAIQKAIDWKTLPMVSSTDLFQTIKSFLVSEKEKGRLLSTTGDLYQTFIVAQKNLGDSPELYAQFKTCIGRVESRDLIKRLSFGNLVLLQPELLDSYASALVNIVKDEPDGLGSISEIKVKTGDFPMSHDERIKDKEQEKLLLIAMIEDLLRYEIALREGSYLVFPSQSTRENPDLPDPEGKAVIFSFEGPVSNIYTTLAVRLSHSGIFKKVEIWKNAATFTTKAGGTYGMFLQNIHEGQSELVLFFDKKTSEDTRSHFEDFVKTQLERHALPESIHRKRIISCSNCKTTITPEVLERRQERGFDWIICPVCDDRVSISDKEQGRLSERLSVIEEMNRTADALRERDTATFIIKGKIETNDFDVFLCHNSRNKNAVKEIGEKLKSRGILPWLDVWELQPGLPWQSLLEQQIEKIKSAAIFVGKDGIGPWQQEELRAFLSEFVKRGCPVIPVLLTEAPKKPELPIFLKARTWVDFRKQEPDPMEMLIWGITGKRSSVK